MQRVHGDEERKSGDRHGDEVCDPDVTCIDGVVSVLSRQMFPEFQGDGDDACPTAEVDGDECNTPVEGPHFLGRQACVASPTWVTHPEEDVPDPLVFFLLTVDAVDTPLPGVDDASVGPVHAYASETEMAERMGPRRTWGTSTNMVVTGVLPCGAKLGFVFPFRPYCEVRLPVDQPESTAYAHFQTVVVPLLMSALRCREEPTLWLHRDAELLGFRPDPADPLRRRRFSYVRVLFGNRYTVQAAATLLRRLVPKRYREDTRPPPTPAQTALFHSLPRGGYFVAEDGIDVVTCMLERFQWSPSQWHVIRWGTVAPHDRRARANRRLHVDVELDNVPFQAVVCVGRAPPGVAAGVEAQLPGGARSVPLLHVAVLDGEMTSGRIGSFPTGVREEEAVTVVSVVYAWVGGVPGGLAAARPALRPSVEYERHAYVLGKACPPIPGVVVHSFSRETELLAAVRDALFVVKRVDVVAGHNLLGFDLRYFIARMSPDRAPDRDRRFFRWGALITEAVRPVDRDATSGGMGANKLRYLPGAGFAYLDTLLYVKTHKKYASNSLDAVCAALKLPVSKFDMPKEFLPVICASEDAVAWGALVRYCVQDSVCCLRVAAALNAVAALLAMSAETSTPCAVASVSGQQVRVRNYVLREAVGMVKTGVNVRDRVPTTTHRAATGGLVQVPVTGHHRRWPVVTLDFEGLYPSIMMAFNICMSTLVGAGDVPPGLRKEAGGPLDVRMYPTDTGSFEFVYNVGGVGPVGLRRLKDLRKAEKEVMEAHPKGSPMYENANNRQNAIKTVQNSLYGAATTHEDRGIMPCHAVGATTCYLGRTLISEAKALVESKFGALTVYGDTDSIMVCFPGQGGDSVLGLLQEAVRLGRAATEAANEYFATVRGVPLIRMAFENVSFPTIIGEKKKQYAKHCYNPDAVAKFADDAAAKAGGYLMLKGLRAVRRDVPAFARSLTNDLLRAVCVQWDVDAAWGVVHTMVENVVGLRLPLEAYALTKELKGTYATCPSVPEHLAVAYAAEWAVPGSAPRIGDRVSYVLVEERDDRRLMKPPGIWKDVAEPGAVRVGDAEDETDAEDDDDEDAGKASVRGKKKSEDYRAAHARSLDEVRKDPANNHLDVVYYVEVVINSIVGQLFPRDKAAIQELVTYAKEHAAAHRRQRAVDTKVGLYRSFFRVQTDKACGAKVTLSHKAPADAAAAGPTTTRQASLPYAPKEGAVVAAAKRPAAAPSTTTQTHLPWSMATKRTKT